MSSILAGMDTIDSYVAAQPAEVQVWLTLASARH
jgi:hypothetical protein